MHRTLHDGRAAAATRLDGSWAQAVGRRLAATDAVSAVMLLGASMLLSTLPLIIALGSIADQRVDDDLSRHIGLNGEASALVDKLFRSTPAHDVGAIVPAVVIGLLGTVTVVASLQGVYERLFGLPRRGWRDAPRFVVWVVVVLGVLVFEGVTHHSVTSAAGPVVFGIQRFAVAVLLFGWSMHFLLAGRVRWSMVARPALVTAVFWVGLALFSRHVFSSTLVSDSRLYGTIGVTFTLLMWFLSVAAVLVLGAAAGVVWNERRGAAAATPAALRTARTPDPAPPAPRARSRP